MRRRKWIESVRLDRSQGWIRVSRTLAGNEMERVGITDETAAHWFKREKKPLPESLKEVAARMEQRAQEEREAQKAEAEARRAWKQQYLESLSEEERADILRRVEERKKLRATGRTILEKVAGEMFPWERSIDSLEAFD